MTPARIRKRPLEATAVTFTGHNDREVIAWATAGGGEVYAAGGNLYVGTDRGDVCAEPGDWIIRGLVGEFYPCTPAAFHAGWEVIG